MTVNNLILLFFLLTAAYATEAASPREAVPYLARGGLGNTHEKLVSGESARIAYLGGSITQQDGWRVMTQAWLKAQYPETEIIEIAAGLGGTNAELGAFRVYRDVLQHHPDLVFIEFAVNDGKTPAKLLTETMEGIIRQIWKADPETDICFVYTISEALLPQTEGGKYFADAAGTMEAIADYYDIPSIYMAYEVPGLAKEGTLLMRTKKPMTDAERQALEGKILFAKDGVHPYTDTGHAVYFKQIKGALPELFEVGETGPHTLPEPLEPNNYDDAAMYSLDRVTMEGDWKKLDMLTHPVGKRLRSKASELWLATKKGDKISFPFKGTYVGIYGVRGPDSGAYTFSLNGKVKTDKLFDKYCAYHRMSGTAPFGPNLPEGTHYVEIEVSDQILDKEALLKEEHRQQDLRDNPEKYEGNNLYLAALMIRGELLEE